MKTALGIFCKQPVPGNVKTRLASAIGNEPAVRLYEAFLTDVVANLKSVADRRILCYSPDSPASRDWFRRIGSSHYECLPQSAGDLGDRLTAFFKRAIADGAAKVVVIGSDCPTITADDLREAFTRLDHSDAVLGRSDDGGYYLVGLRRWASDLFAGIDWSTSAVYDQQLSRLTAAGLTTSTLPPVPEVDTLADLNRLRDHQLLPLAANTHRLLLEISRT